MNDEEKPKIFEFCNGELDIWCDAQGTIFIQNRNKFGDPVEVWTEEAKRIAILLEQLANE